MKIRHWGKGMRGMLPIAMSLSLASQPLMPALAFADDTTEETAVDEAKLDELWTAVLEAEGQEATARANLMTLQEDIASDKASVEDLEAQVKELEKRQEALGQSVSDMREFLENPSDGSTVYIDALLDVADAVTALSDANSAVDDAKARYATARQARLDTKAALESYDGTGTLDAAKARNDAAAAYLETLENEASSAASELTQASSKMQDLVAKAGGTDANKELKQAQDGVDTATTSLAKATKARETAEAAVTEDEAKAKEGGTDKRAPHKTGTYLNGVDISGYEGGIDFSGMDVDFAIVKALEGPNPDGEWYRSDFEDRVKTTLDNNMLLGFYHFYTTNTDPVTQARRFVDEVGDYAGTAAYFLDWESRTYGWGGDSPVVELDPSVAKQWLDEVYRLTGVRPGIYMSRSVTTMHDWSAVAKDYPLWVAAYPSTAWTDGFELAYHEPYGGEAGAWGSDPLIWQYSSSTHINGWDGLLDVNVFYGDAGDWAELARQDWSIKLSTDQKKLEEAKAAESKAQESLTSAESKLAAASESVRNISPEVTSAIDTVTALTKAKEEADAAAQAARGEAEEAKATLAAEEAKRSDLQAAIDDAEKEFTEAEAAITQSKEKVEQATAHLEDVRRHKEVIASIAEMAQGDATDQKSDSTEVATTSGTILAGGIGDMMMSVLPFETEALAAGRTDTSALPSSKDILADPSVLDAAIKGESDEGVADVLRQMRDTAQERKDTMVEVAQLRQAVEDMKGRIQALQTQEPELTSALGNAQESVQQAQAAFVKVAPDGKLRAPAGYSDRHENIFASEVETASHNEPSLVSLWLGLFVMASAAVIGAIVIAERREARQEASQANTDQPWGMGR